MGMHGMKSVAAMSDGWRALRQFLTVEPDDVGCAGVFALLDVYVERTLAGLDPRVEYPGVAAHLSACDPCAEDFQGMLVALRRGMGANER